MLLCINETKEMQIKYYNPNFLKKTVKRVNKCKI